MKLNSLDVSVFVTSMLAVMALGWFATRRAVGTKRDSCSAAEITEQFSIFPECPADNTPTDNVFKSFPSKVARLRSSRSE
jgi:predicted RNase H-like nuclease